LSSLIQKASWRLEGQCERRAFFCGLLTIRVHHGLGVHRVGGDLLVLTVRPRLANQAATPQTSHE
jgi:hypothetical protein